MGFTETWVRGGTGVILLHGCTARDCPHTTEAHVAQIVDQLRLASTDGAPAVAEATGMESVLRCTPPPCVHVAEDGTPLAERGVEFGRILAARVPTVGLARGESGAARDVIGHSLTTEHRESAASVLDRHIARLERFRRRHS